jgi:hypothetical protein
MNSNKLVLPLNYFPNIQYYSLLAGKDVEIEVHDNFRRKTYRNRCEIATANGVINLTVPVTKTQPKIKIKDLKISYTEDWQNNHIRAIRSAYGSSPYFEYYFDDITALISQNEIYLKDLNLKIIDKINQLLSIDSKYKLTKDYIPDADNDFRELILPKFRINSQDKTYKSIEYIQVFSDRRSFESNLSILDLLFNEGPNAAMIIKSSRISD